MKEFNQCNLVTITCVMAFYSITFANDEPARDPFQWTQKGSQDGSPWTVLDTKSNQFFANRFEKEDIYFHQSTAL